MDLKLGWVAVALFSFGVWAQAQGPRRSCDLLSLLDNPFYRQFHNARVVDRKGRWIPGLIRISEERVWFYPTMNEPILLASGNPIQVEAGVHLDSQEIQLTHVEVYE